MNKWLELVIGLILILVGVLAIIYWKFDVIRLIKGSIGILILLIGLMFGAIAIEDFKN